MSRTYIHQNILLGFLLLLRHVAPAIVAFTTLRLGMEVVGAPFNEAYLALLIIVILLALIIMRDSPQQYVQHSSEINNTAIAILWQWTVLFGILLLLGYVTKTSSIFSRKLLLSWAVLTPVVILIVQLAIDIFISRIRNKTTSNRRVVVAGANSLGCSLAEKINSYSNSGLELVGLFDDRSADRLGDMHGLSRLGGLSELPDFVRENKIDVIYIALPMRNIQRVTDLLNELSDTTVSIYYVPDIFVFDLIQCRVDDIDGFPVVALCETPFYGVRGIKKRLVDVVLSLAILILISPLLVIIATAIKLTTPGSVIFKQQRYGLDSQEITVYKFRTMYVNEDRGEVRQATRADSRVTPIGAFLRRYSLDELPQFFNVLQGHMSIVGPRPHAISHNEEYRKLIKGYMIRHKVNPGLTGLAQIRGLRGETSTVDDMRQRVEADLEYLRNWSLGLDFKIILKTIGRILTDNKAY